MILTVPLEPKTSKSLPYNGEFEYTNVDNQFNLSNHLEAYMWKDSQTSSLYKVITTPRPPEFQA